MLYRVSSTTNDTRTLTNTGYTWSSVLLRTCRCFARGIVGLGSSHLICPLYNPVNDCLDRQYLPEPFLWDTFYHLVNAAATMKDGPKGVNKKYEIVHRDLKPANGKTFHIDCSIVGVSTQPLSVFLGDENPEKGFPFYPVAKLGDYGLAVTTNREDLSNPRNYRGPGTRGYKAPVSSEMLAETHVADPSRRNN